jgi:hypothetical protein
MLSEFDMMVPPVDDEPSRYRLFLTAFGHFDLPLDVFEGPFYARLASDDTQDDLDRALVWLLHEMDQVDSPADRVALESRMRAAVRARLPLA